MSTNLQPLGANASRVAVGGKRRLLILQAKNGDVSYGWGESTDTVFSLAAGEYAVFADGAAPRADLWAKADAVTVPQTALACYSEDSDLGDLSRVLEALGKDQLLVVNIGGVRALEGR